MTIRILTLVAAALAAGIAMASAQTAPGQDPNHPGTDAQTKPAAPPPQRPAARGPMQPGAMPMQRGGQGMMMGGDMAQMMTMMQMMQMMQGGGMMPMGMAAWR